MKMLFNIIILGIFSIEICSPFLIGYLNNQEKKMKASNEYFIQSKLKNIETQLNTVNKCENRDLKINGNSSASCSKSAPVKK